MKKYILAMIFLSHTCFISAQTTDRELWAGAELNLKMHKRFSVQGTQVFKFNNNISHFKSAYTEFGAKFKINRFFSIGANYRYIENPPTKNAQRYSGDFFFNLEKKEFPLSFQYRFRYQKEVRISNNNNEDFIRSKFSLDYNLCKLVDPYISYEPFFRLNGKNEFRVMRYAFGLNWRLAEDFHLTSFYMFQKDINIKRPNKNHIIGLIFSYDIKTYKKKSKAVPSIK